jgi:organic hydroperoxide reductase OsmC/OhrA
MSTASVEARPRPKAFTYHTAVDRVVGRSAVLRSGEKPPLDVSAPAEFKGDSRQWSPEDFFVAALEVCLMLSFVGIAEKKGVPFVSYVSSAEGLLEWVEDSYRFTKVVIRPQIVVSAPEGVRAVEEVLDRAHRTCLVANSVRSFVVIEPSITTVEARK